MIGEGGAHHQEGSNGLSGARPYCLLNYYHKCKYHLKRNLNNVTLCHTDLNEQYQKYTGQCYHYYIEVPSICPVCKTLDSTYPRLQPSYKKFIYQK
jgi:hypothetical protein